jgi:nucleotide-binding universal stress UspA family protein
MTIDEPIVCGVDGSPDSQRAAVTARMLAEALRCALVLVHVLPPRPAMPLASVPVAGHPVGTAQMAELDQLESDAAFTSVADVLAGAETEAIVERGHVVDRLSAVADSRNARFIVVGTRGAGAARSALLGSVSRDMAASASRPVVVVPEPDADATGSGLGPGPVVCGVDGSDGSRAAARVAMRLADELHSALTLVSVRAPGATGDQRAGGPAVTALSTPMGDNLERLAISGEPAEELARAAAERRAAVVVVGSRGRGSVRAALLGSVSAELPRLADCPVVIVPPAAAESELELNAIHR